MLTESETRWLLHDLCIQPGFCLPPAAARRLEQNPPNDPGSFTAAVLRADGLESRTVERQLHRGVLALVTAAFERSDHREGWFCLERGDTFAADAP